MENWIAEGGRRLDRLWCFGRGVAAWALRRTVRAAVTHCRPGVAPKGEPIVGPGQKSPEAL